jgi:transposase
MMSKRARYTEEFKRDAIVQVTGRGHSVRDVSKRLGVSTKSLNDWIKQYSKPESVLQEEDNLSRENRRLKSELMRVTEESDILKKAAAYFAKESK